MLVLFLTVSVITLIKHQIRIHAQPNGGLTDYQTPTIDDPNPSPHVRPHLTKENSMKTYFQGPPRGERYKTFDKRVEYHSRTEVKLGQDK